MAPLYQRYIPGVTPVTTSVEEKSLKEPQQHEATEKRKREAVYDQKSSRKAARTREELAGSDEEVTVDTAPYDGMPEELTLNIHERTGEFAHIKNSKKRHKLEKEARQAKKRAEKAGGIVQETTSDGILRAAVTRDESPLDNHDERALEATDLESDAVQDKQEVVRKAKKQKHKRQEQEAEDVNDSVEIDDKEHLKKHASLLGKFDKAQKRAARAAEVVSTEEIAIQEMPTAVTKIDPLVPIEMDLSVPEHEPAYSALPAWITSAKRIADTATTTFDGLNLEPSTAERLRELNFTSALPVQQALLPLLLPPGIRGSQHAAGTESLLPDVAVSAPTGSGKTLAYLLPIIEALKKQHIAQPGIRGLIVVPTRELVTQVASLAEDLAKGSDLKIDTATGTGKLKDEQQRLITTDHKYDPETYRRLLKYAQMLDCPPADDSAGFVEYVRTIDDLDEDTRHQIKDAVECPVDYIQTYWSSADILICTPGRLLEHLDNTTGFDLSHVSWLVLDEADKLLDEQYNGFLDRLNQELGIPRTPNQQGAREKFLRKMRLWDEHVERRIRKVVLSATMTRDVSQLAALRLRRPRLIIVGAQQDTTEGDGQIGDDQAQIFELPGQLQEYCVPVGDGSAKPLYLLQLLETRILDDYETGTEDELSTSSSDDSSDAGSESDESESGSSATSASTVSSSGTSETSKPDRDETVAETTAPTILIFTASTEAALRLTHLLKQLRPRLASQITSLTKGTAVANLAAKGRMHLPCLVIATDRAGRGLDMVSSRHISHVVQYDVPRSLTAYVHRVGRTARADRFGQAWTLYTNAEARWFINEVTKAGSIRRASQVQRVRFQVDDEKQSELYRAALASMRDLVFNNARRK